MNTSLKARLSLILVVLFFACPSFADRIKIEVLFIGNSFTFVNNLPLMLSEIANSLGDEADTDMAAPGGYSLQNHVNDPNTRAKIQSKPWSFVVLQEQSQHPAFPLQQFDREVVPYVTQLDSFIHQNNAATQTVLYETWGFENGDTMNCQNMPTICTYAGMQDLIDVRLTALAQQIGALLAPVGEAWWQTRYYHPEINLYASDNKHPSPEGTYLAACIFYRLLFKKSVIGAAPLGLPQNEADILQSIAQDITK